MGGSLQTLGVAGLGEAAGPRRLPESARVAFVFPGQGAQWIGMGWRLAGQEPVFRRELERCDEVIHRLAGWSLLAELEAGEPASRLAATDVVQPAIFALQVALAALWRSWGLEPGAVVGQSLGEVAAAHVAGALELEDAARVICESSRLFATLGGGMMVVEQAEDRLLDLLAEYDARVHLAIRPSPRSVVLSGDRAALAEIARRLEPARIFCRFVEVAFGCHHPGVAQIDGELRRRLAVLRPRPAEVTMLSTVTGRRVGGLELDAGYWCRNWARPVAFGRAIRRLAEYGRDVFVELSPHPLLVGAVREVLAAEERRGLVVGSLRRAGARRELLRSLARLQGGEVDEPAARRWPIASDELARVGETPAADWPASPKAGRTVADCLRRRAAQVLRLPADRLGGDVALTSLGLDSLQAVELRQLLEKDLAGTFSTASLLGGEGLAAVAESLETALAGAADPGPALRRVEVSSRDHPLSAGQKALWFLHRLAPDSPVYNVPVALAFDRPVSAGALRLGLGELARRHPVLRTRFDLEGKEPRQTFDRGSEPWLAVEDAAGWSRRELDERLARDAWRPFDLTRDPVWRTHVYAGSSEGDVVLVVLHHVAADFWSLTVLLRELGALLAASAVASEGAGSQPGPPLPDPPALRFSDFARWQAAWLGSPAARRELSYWRDRLGEPPPPIELPADRRRPRATRFRGGSCSRLLDAELTPSVRAAARRRGTTVFVTLLAAFQALLHRLTGQDDLAVGTPTAGRADPRFDGVVGYFVNPVALRVDLSGDPTCGQLVERCQEVALGAFEHPTAPFPWLVDRLAPRREADRSPVFDVMFVLEQAHRPEEAGLAAGFVGARGARVRLGGLAARCLPVAERSALFDLTLRVAELDGRYAASLQYSSDLFDATTVRRFLGHYEQGLRGLVAEPGRRLSRLPWLSPAERQQLTREWGEASRCFAGEPGGLYELFAARAARHPDAVAVAGSGEQITYGELDRRARRLARRLLALGVVPEARVGLCVERGTEMLAGILGILASGAGYVPLDPAQPRARLATMAAEGRLAVLVGEARTEPLAAELAGAVGGVARLHLPLAASRDDRPAPLPRIRRESTAYCLFTSGSTGRPKGVVVSHGAVARLFRVTAEHFDFRTDDVWTLFHSYGFDFSVWEMWGAWVHGGRLVVVARETSRSPEAFRQLLARERVSVLNQTPSAFSELVAADAGERALAALRWVIFGGEALGPGRLDRWLERYGDESPRLVDMYGITETTVHVTCRRLRRRDVTAGAPVDVGRGLRDLHLGVLDAGGRTLPLGVAGELYVGGAGLARGYLRNPAGTAERFLPDGHSRGEPGGRLYRTGDRVRLRPDGRVVYLGRCDQQVQVRGYRVEPAEIEAVLSRHPEVRRALVTPRWGAAGGCRLVAYVVAPEAGAGLVRELRAALARELPGYLRPAALVVLASLPLSANGKLDLAALPEPSRSRPPLEADYLAPRGALERTLSAIWCEVLELDRVGAGDNFFEAGGHSLLLTRVQRRLAEHGHAVPIVELLRRPTIRSLAAHLSRQAPSTPPPRRRGGSRPSLGQQRQARRRHRAGPRGRRDE